MENWIGSIFQPFVVAPMNQCFSASTKDIFNVVEGLQSTIRARGMVYDNACRILT